MSGGAVALGILVGACLGMLVGIFMLLARLLARLEEMHEEVKDRIEEASDNVLDADEERRRHLDAVSEIVIGHMFRIGRGLAAEIEAAAKGEQGNDAR
jgi:hypothetical protein